MSAVASRTCLVCGAPSDYAHFGVASCRSCADFYKRTVDAGRSYPCRQGDGKCAINQKDRRNCRGCRFDACCRVGMRIVQQVKSFDASTCLCRAPRITDTLLTRISREHAMSLARRKVGEYTLQNTSLHRRVKADFTRDHLLLCTFAFIMDSFKVTTREHWRFAAACFPEFAVLPKEEQQLLLGNFSVRLFNAENHINTEKRFGSHDGPLTMATVTTCYDWRNYEFFTENELPSAGRTMAKLKAYSLDRINRLMGPILKKARFSDVEYTAIIALSVWQFDPNQSLPEHIIELCRDVRRQIFIAIEQHYKDELLLDEYSVRLGNLVTFEHTLQARLLALMTCTMVLFQEVMKEVGELLQTFRLSGLLNNDAKYLQDYFTVPF